MRWRPGGRTERAAEKGESERVTAVGVVLVVVELLAALWRSSAAMWRRQSMLVLPGVQIAFSAMPSRRRASAATAVGAQWALATRLMTWRCVSSGNGCDGS